MCLSRKVIACSFVSLQRIVCIQGVGESMRSWDVGRLESVTHAYPVCIQTISLVPTISNNCAGTSSTSQYDGTLYTQHLRVHLAHAIFKPYSAQYPPYTSPNTSPSQTYAQQPALDTRSSSPPPQPSYPHTDYAPPCPAHRSIPPPTV
jgi:hypothetical protein